uniref:Uncharacterized protein n=1 Tax=Cucumis melo TaxID=3656 RepID=A0A9I9E798_CUCME
MLSLKNSLNSFPFFHLHFVPVSAAVDDLQLQPRTSVLPFLSFEESSIHRASALASSLRLIIESPEKFKPYDVVD